MNTSDIVFPVLLTEPKNGLPKDFGNSEPFTYIKVCAQSALGQAVPTTAKVFRALIDTGAEFCAIDETAAISLGASSGASAVLHGFGQSVSSSSVSVSLYSVCGRMQHNTDLLTQPLKQQKFNCDLILGRSFLRYCKLEFDCPSNIYKLSWVFSANT